MLKLIFWSLLCINAALFAFGRGYLGNFKPSEREPQRIARQMGTDKLVLLSTAGAAVARPAARAPAPAAVVTDEPAACTEIAQVGEREARRLDKLLEPLALGEKLTKTAVTVQEITSYMVMIPPLGSKEAADRKATELKERGVSNYFIMNDTSVAKWAISLGVFKSEAAAQTLLAALTKQGVSGAKVVGRPSAATRLAYRFRNIDPDTKAKLAAIAAQLDGLDTRSCK